MASCRGPLLLDCWTDEDGVHLLGKAWAPMRLDSTIDLVPNLIRGRSRDGRNLYSKSAKPELV